MSAPRKPVLAEMPNWTIRILPDTKKQWPKFGSVRDMPLADRLLMADHIAIIHHDDPFWTEEGLFFVANSLRRAGLRFRDLAECVLSEVEAAKYRAEA